MHALIRQFPRRMYPPVFILALLAAGCSQQQGARLVEPSDSADLPVVAERSDVHSSYARPLRVVIHDRGTLAALGLINLPVDFSQQMVLLAAMGPAHSEDCQVRISRVWRDGNRLRVEVVNSYPPVTELHRARSTSPYHAIVVPNSRLPIDNFSAEIPRNALSGRGMGKP